MNSAEAANDETKREGDRQTRRLGGARDSRAAGPLSARALARVLYTRRGWMQQRTINKNEFFIDCPRRRREKERAR